MANTMDFDTFRKQKIAEKTMAAPVRKEKTLEEQVLERQQEAERLRNPIKRITTTLGVDISNQTERQDDIIYAFREMYKGKELYLEHSESNPDVPSAIGLKSPHQILATYGGEVVLEMGARPASAYKPGEWSQYVLGSLSTKALTASHHKHASKKAQEAKKDTDRGNYESEMRARFGL